MQYQIKIIFVCLLFFSSLVLMANATTNTNVTNSQKTILVGQEESLLTITLPSNPTTGFSWLLASYDSALLKVVKHQYISPSHIENKVGVSSVEQWQFTVKPNLVGPQVTKIHFIHARPWDVEHTTIEEKTFTVVIH